MLPSSFAFRLTLSTTPLLEVNFDRDDAVVAVVDESKVVVTGGVEGNAGKSSSSRPGGFGCSGA